MKCIQCKNIDTHVVESRDAGAGEVTRRRRECDKCHCRFTTYERVEKPQIVVVKNNGNRELFNREKLLSGLYKACEKTSITTVQLEKVASDIEQQIYDEGENEVPTVKIGAMIMDKLVALDEVAYVRFASVYRRFKDIAGFERELQRVKEHKSRK